MTETRTVHDPFLGKDVQVSNKLTDRLRGKYANGPTMANGEPEFGWRQFDVPPIQHQAAAEIEQLQLELDKAKSAATIEKINYGIMISDAVKLLRPFALLAEICDHFKHLPGKEICSWRIDGERRKGPTADDCRKARDFLNKIRGDWA
jgi:hypothetical protein